MLHIGCSEDIEGRAVFNLPGEIRSPTKTQDNFDAASIRELLTEFLKGIGQICSGGDDNFGVLRGFGRGLHGPTMDGSREREEARAKLGCGTGIRLTMTDSILEVYP